MCMQNHDEQHSSLEKYTSHFIRKGCVWEGVGDWTELQHIDPHSYGHNSVSFPLSWAAYPGAQPLWVLDFSTASYLRLIWSPTADFLSSPGLYNNLTPSLLPASVTISHSFNLSTVTVIISWYSWIGCTCYLHRCISYFDSLAGSEVNIQQKFQSWTRTFTFYLALIPLGKTWTHLFSPPAMGSSVLEKENSLKNWPNITSC